MAETSLLDRASITRRKLDVDEYHRMGEAGILHEDDRVELIEGDLVEMAPIGSPHASTVNTLAELLGAALGRRAIVAPQNPIRLDDRSEPQPDLAVLRRHEHRYYGRLPGPDDVLLIVEVADSSLRHDRDAKLPLYAKHGIPEVWIVNLVDKLVEVCRDPRPDGCYGTVAPVGRGGALEPALLPGAVINVDDILGWWSA
jgi:Uma2 family endonuclease